MKKLIVFAAIVLTLSLNAYAEKSECKNFSRLATAVIEAKQAGVLMSDVFTLGDGDMTKAIEFIAIKAYLKPNFRTEKIKNRQVIDFTNEMFLMCIRAV